MSTLFIDVTELFEQFAAASHPTGISRVIINLADELAASPGRFASVVPFFWHPVQRRPLAIGGNVLGPLRTFFPALRDRYRSAGMAPASMTRLQKQLVTAIPKPFRFALFPRIHGITRFASLARREGLVLTPVRFAKGDCLFVPGSFWLGGYMPGLARLADAASVAIVAYIHDVLLLAHPDWLPARHAEQFRNGVETFLPRCTAIACNSRSTAAEIRRHVKLPPDLPITVCRLADAPCPPALRPLRSEIEKILTLR